jgi:membrane protein implicated in regulation of membrane protease activity
MKIDFLNNLCEYEKKGGVFPLIPYTFKWIGVIIAMAAAGILLAVKIVDLPQGEFYKQLLMHVILIGLFLFVIAKEKNEDERILKLRYRAFAFAFVLGTVMILLMPLAATALDAIAHRLPLEWEQDQSIFFIMSSFLFYYLMYFQIFKRQL